LVFIFLNLIYFNLKSKENLKIGIIIGPEGGIEKEEIELLENAGAKIVTLGKRILRTETAAITSVAMCMLHAEMYLGEE
jgi:16S rRNA (uracil1498-N3)-methyltransferase